eukprot:687281-Rhodomonas_salina.3
MANGTALAAASGSPDKDQPSLRPNHDPGAVRRRRGVNLWSSWSEIVTPSGQTTSTGLSVSKVTDFQASDGLIMKPQPAPCTP